MLNSIVFLYEHLAIQKLVSFLFQISLYSFFIFLQLFLKYVPKIMLDNLKI